MLSFDSFSNHDKCDRCAELTAQMASAPNHAVKTEKAALLKKHLEEQWQDRLVYWRMRQAGRQRVYTFVRCVR